MAQVELGMNYSWWRFDRSRMVECAHRPGMIWQGNWIIDQYQNSAVRTIVQGQLRTMRAAGFTRLRTFITYKRPPVGKLSGILMSTTGSLSAQDAQNVREFVSDIARAGFGGLEIAYGFFGRNAPYCRQQAWGDCFDAARTNDNWRFISGAAQIALSAARSMPIRFDLGNEACPAANMPRSAVTNAAKYLTTIAGRFQTQFGANWVISCPDSPNSARAVLMAKILRRAGLSPRFVEIHSYRVDPRWLYGVLDGANNLAQQLGATVIIGEMRYHSRREMGIIHSWLHARPQARLREIFEWPLRDPATGCGMDTPPPYTP